MRKILYGQEYTVAKVDIIKKRFDREAAIDQCVVYLHGLSQLPGYPRYNVDRITSCTCLNFFPIDNNAMLGSAQLMVDFRGMRFNANKTLFINFQKHDSIFCKEIIRKINGGGHGQFYVLTTSVCATQNNDLPMYDI